VLGSRGALRPGLTVSDAADVLWLFNDPAVYQRLVIERGWSRRRYETWLGDTAIAAVLDTSYESPGR
jgi:hypothetical protein